MEVKSLNGIVFRSMLKNALANLLKNEKIINDLNVFPVPDGDTGSNMRLTLENGVKTTRSEESIGLLAKALSKGMLLGARGNSGVILSQLFKGLSLVLSEYNEVNAKVFADGLIQSYKTAYEAVVKPTEGTLLTVAREAIEAIYDEIDENTTINELFIKYLENMEVSLAATPNKLQVLKDAGVVDSGGAGLICIYDGMLKYLNCEIIEEIDLAEYKDTPIVINKDMEFGYCTEFIIQLNDKNEFERSSFLDFLETQGDSIVCVEDDGIVKVHIHTKNPGFVISYAQQYGEFSNVKIENMELQHSEVIASKPKKKIAYIAVAQGEGICDLFKELGCDTIINGGQTMNTSSEEFIKAIKKLNAEDIIIMPNNPNIYLAALQAVKILENSHIHILKTKSIVDGYFALSMCVNDEDTDIDLQLANMNQGISNVNTLLVCPAVRDTTINGTYINENDGIAILDGNLVSNSKSLEECVLNGLSSVDEIDDKEIIIIFKGINADDDESDKIVAEIEDRYPNAQIGLIDGGQDVYDYILGVS